LSGPLFHYNNSVILRFSPKLWLYLLEANGLLTPIDGVTNTLKIVDKSAALIGWSTRLFLETAIRLSQQFRRGDFVEAEWNDYVAMLAYSKDEHKRVLEAAGDTGHSAHAFVESLVKATMADDEARRLEILAKFPEDERAMNAAVAAVCFFADHNVRYISAEQRVFSLEWRVAGTMDGDILIDSCDREECPCQEYAPFINKRVCLDLKTSNQIVGRILHRPRSTGRRRQKNSPTFASMARSSCVSGKTTHRNSSRGSPLAMSRRRSISRSSSGASI
jgi:hypothetical protein